ncbi:MAG TPA: hypothetical protein VGF18_10200 [Candidatus Tumulicola sp.]
MPLRDTVEAAGNEAKRSTYEVQHTVDSMFDHAATWLRGKVDVNALVSKLFDKLRR